ncbi:MULTISPECIES: hypothetical protein [unclassified Wolbachia]|nr:MULTISPECIES: hypothetical protein [unclassified Wolbachia]
MLATWMTEEGTGMTEEGTGMTGEGTSLTTVIPLLVSAVAV